VGPGLVREQGSREKAGVSSGKKGNLLILY